jgi:hypothetical protein
LTTPITQLNVTVGILLTCDIIWLSVVVSSRIQFDVCLAINMYLRHKYRALYTQIVKLRFRFMVFNATINNISVISLLSVLLVEETGVPQWRKPPTCHKSLTNGIT